jgi:hypothetical protein
LINLVLTALLLLPVAAILVWLYWFLLPGRKWLLVDSGFLLMLFFLVVMYLYFVSGLDFESAGPLWPYIVSTAGAYGILLLGFALALYWRRQSKKIAE